MYLMQQMQPRAMTESTNTARNEIGQNKYFRRSLIKVHVIPSEGSKEYSMGSIIVQIFTSSKNS